MTRDGSRQQTAGEEAPAPRRIFRPVAVDRYVSRAMETVLPRFVAPRSLSWLWLAAAVLLVTLLLLALLLDGRTEVLSGAWIGRGLLRA